MVRHVTIIYSAFFQTGRHSFNYLDVFILRYDHRLQFINNLLQGPSSEESRHHLLFSLLRRGCLPRWLSSFVSPVCMVLQENELSTFTRRQSISYYDIPLLACVAGPL
jgi:hypothetical protein